jgi:3-hydroxyacyl-CoA dehydrogenase/enoyl-CoA hydratase/3-hydroxybutyryl-CoA epimerase
MSSFFHYREEDGVARLTLDLENKPVNLLSTEVMTALDETFAGLQERNDLHLLVIDSAKPGVFIAGADINEIKDIREPDDAYMKAKMGQDVLNRLETMPFPSLAYINGACMGGGTELALACTFRVVGDSPRVKIALPEVNLGIMPGFGGTQRLPRLIDISQALPMILTGKNIDARKAEKIGLADRGVPEGYFDFFLKKFAAAVAKQLPSLKSKRSSASPSAETAVNRGRAWQFAVRKALYGKIRLVKRGSIQYPKRGWFLNETGLGRSIALNAAKKQVMAKTQGNYPSPLTAIETLKKTLGGNFARGLQYEARRFAELAVSDISKKLIDIYFLTEAAKKLPDPDQVPGAGGAAGSANLPEKIGQTGVLGAGVMGGGIAWLFANAGYDVALKDIAWDAVKKGWDAAMNIYRQLKNIRKVDDRLISLGMHRISGTLDYRSFTRADLVVEAVVEKMPVKKAVLAELEDHVGASAILATNTSSLSVSEMAAGLKHPGRFAGMHFFNPVNRMPLVEVISGDKTDPKTAIEIARFALKLKKTPVFVKDGPGFLVNRILMPYLNEAAYLLSDGAEIRETDRLWKIWGMPMGPFTLIDEIGIDVARHVALILEEAFPDRMKAAPMLKLLADHPDVLGKKNGRGFYLYKDGKKDVNPEMTAIIKAARSGSGAPAKRELINRPLVMMVNEAIRCLDEGIVQNAGMLDLAMIFGTGFPPFRGGLLKTADDIGPGELESMARDFASRIDGRFEPAPGLSRRSQSGENFFGQEAAR